MNHRSPSFGSPRKTPRRIAGVAAVTAVLAVVVTGPAAAQSACLAHDKLTQMLDGKYSERPVAFGLEATGKLFEVFAAEDGATWTMVITTPEGASCVVAVGQEWQTPQQLAYDPEM